MGVALEWEYKNLGFGNFVKNVSQKCVVHYEEVELSKTLEYVLERPMFCEVVTRPLVNWLLLSFRTQIFLQWEVQKMEYRKRNRGMNIVDKVNMMDKVDMGDKEVDN